MRKYYLIIPMLISAFLFTGCDDADYPTRENSIYLGAAATSMETAATVVLEPAGLDLNIIVRLAQAVNRPVTVRLQQNPALLEAYNALNGTEYEPLPTDFPEDATVTIKAGEHSGIYTLRVEDFDTQGINYAVPVYISEVLEGGVQKSVSQSGFIYLISKPLIVSVPTMTGANSQQVNAQPTTYWNVPITQYTLETWLRMDGFKKNNQAIFNLGGKEPKNEIYMRFGDANSPYNYLQVKTLGAQIETARDFVANQWYHLAFVYDGTTFTIYRDGDPIGKFDPPAPNGALTLQFVQMVSSGASYFQNKVNMSQVAIWNTALSQAQIKNNMYFAKNPKNPNLIAYWPMDEGSGSEFRDATGNGHDAIAGSGILTGWVHGVRFDQ